MSRLVNLLPLAAPRMAANAGGSPPPVRVADFPPARLRTGAAAAAPGARAHPLRRASRWCQTTSGIDPWRHEELTP
jgi:hypothetical protein